MKCVEIIGEAAGRVSAQGRGTLPGLPWAEMRAMRHRLVHAYYDVNLDIVWSTLRHDLPPLAADLEGILSEQ